MVVNDVVTIYIRHLYNILRHQKNYPFKQRNFSQGESTYEVSGVNQRIFSGFYTA